MKVQKKEICFEDERGSILDVVESVNFNGATIIKSVSGSIRGNHFHKHTIQYAFVLEGRILAKSKKVGMELEEVILEPGDLITHDVYEAHMYKALVDSKFIVLSSGLRSGKDYELDTYRIQSSIENFSQIDIE